MASHRRNVIKLVVALVVALSLALSAPLLQAQSGKTEVLWLGQAAFKITTPGGKVIVTDPFLTGNPKTPAEYKATRLRYYLRYAEEAVYGRHPRSRRDARVR
jgi:hypothetical protein